MPSRACPEARSTGGHEPRLGHTPPVLAATLPLALLVGTSPAAALTGALPRVSADTVVDRTIAILVLSGDKSGFPVSEVYGAARRPLERNTALRVAPLEAIGLAERDDVIRACAGDAACFVRRLRAARDDVDLLLTVSVDRPDEDLLLGLRLIRTRDRTAIAAVGDEVPFGMSLEGAMERRLPDLVPPSVWGQVATVEVLSVPSSAEVSFADRTCITPCRLERMRPGFHEVLLRKSGRLPWRETVSLGRGANRVEATLAAPKRSLLENPWFWTAVGVAAVAGGVATWALLDQDDPGRVLCFSADESLCSPR